MYNTCRSCQCTELSLTLNLPSETEKLIFKNLFNLLMHLNRHVQLVGLPRCPHGRESACNGGNTRNAGSVPGMGRSPGGDIATHSSILAWRIPYPLSVGLLVSNSPEDCKELKTTVWTEHTCMCS